MLNSIYNWYMKTFLPYEDASHPLHYSNYKKPKCEISEMIDDYYGINDDMIGENYSRKPFSKPTKYKKWGNKWYKEG